MKKFKLAAVLFAIALISTSCTKWFEGVNQDPNNPLDVPESVLLPSIQGALAYGYGGDASRYSAVFMQHATGVTRQFTSINAYQLTENDVNNLWRFNLYAGPMNDAKILIEKAEANGYTEYAGIGKILMAHALMITTDLFGDIPYSEAFQGADNLTPAYDTQSNLYGTIIPGLLNDGIADLSGPSSPLSPGADDMIFGGDVNAWIQTANVLRARLALHQGAKDITKYTEVLNILDSGDPIFTSSADDFTFYFGSSETSANPWYQYNDQRGDIVFSGNLMSTMASITDPRFDMYFDTTGGGANMGPLYGSIGSPVPFATYVEMKFMEAEAAFQSGNTGRAATAHNDAITAHLSQLGITDAGFLAAEASETSGSITLDKIMTHKYIAMYLSPESWTDWRRTDLPSLTAVPVNVTSDVIPTRFPYPQSENLYNPNMPTGLSITSKVWWDQ